MIIKAVLKRRGELNVGLFLHMWFSLDDLFTSLKEESKKDLTYLWQFRFIDIIEQQKIVAFSYYM